MDLEKNEEWQRIVKSNDIGDGKVVVTIAREVMHLLSEDDTPLHNGIDPDDEHTPFGLICLANYNVNEGGISGFLARQVAQMIVKFHDRGEEFRTIWNEDNKI